MSTMRGIVPSLGAGGSLIAASLCAFVVLSAMFAFRDEGGGTADARSGDVTMPAGQVPPAPAAAPVSARPAVRPVRATTSAATTARPVRRGSARVTRPAPAAPAPRLAAPPRTSAPQAPPAPSRPRAPDAPDPVPAATPGPVETVVQQTRAAAGPITDAVPAPVEPVADTVERVAATVDGVTGALLP